MHLTEVFISNIMKRRNKELMYLSKSTKGKKRKNTGTGNYRGRAGVQEVLKGIVLVLLLLVLIALGLLYATREQWASPEQLEALGTIFQQ